MVAALFGHQTVVEHLLTTDNIDINAFNEDGGTAIRIAAEEGHEAIVRLLLDIHSIDIPRFQRRRPTATVPLLSSCETLNREKALRRTLPESANPLSTTKMAPTLTARRFTMTLRRGTNGMSV
ncbi:hypothetical protein BKA70DRAFT_1304585 [Coprinopsis sp. MPI-PUGE-AT-0042]|nr:hypothetical protein BKA70DRAFT_1304585 [Coprinopsis sp. MPI-PUGE-AT-0042]